MRQQGARVQLSCREDIEKAQARTRGIPEDEVAREVMLRPMPKRRFIEIGEIAATVEFLASGAARNITGQCIVIDGGWTAQ